MVDHPVHLLGAVRERAEPAVALEVVDGLNVRGLAGVEPGHPTGANGVVPLALEPLDDVPADKLVPSRAGRLGVVQSPLRHPLRRAVRPGAGVERPREGAGQPAGEERRVRRERVAPVGQRLRVGKRLQERHSCGGEDVPPQAVHGDKDLVSVGHLATPAG